MAGTTLNRNYPYPSGGDNNDVPYWNQALAEAVDADVQTLASSNTEAVATLTYGTGWRAPTTTVSAFIVQPIRVHKVRGRVWFEGGGIENSATTSLLTNGQSGTALTLPVGFRPTNAVVIPAAANVSGSFLAAGQIIIKTDGTVTLQTTTAWSSVAAGAGRFDVAGASWLAA